jgi:hypothetical protein
MNPSIKERIKKISGNILIIESLLLTLYLSWGTYNHGLDELVIMMGSSSLVISYCFLLLPYRCVSGLFGCFYLGFYLKSYRVFFACLMTLMMIIVTVGMIAFKGF